MWSQNAYTAGDGACAENVAGGETLTCAAEVRELLEGRPVELVQIARAQGMGLAVSWNVGQHTSCLESQEKRG